MFFNSDKIYLENILFKISVAKNKIKIATIPKNKNSILKGFEVR